MLPWLAHVCCTGEENASSGWWRNAWDSWKITKWQLVLFYLWKAGGGGGTVNPALCTSEKVSGRASNQEQQRRSFWGKLAQTDRQEAVCLHIDRDINEVMRPPISAPPNTGIRLYQFFLLSWQTKSLRRAPSCVVAFRDTTHLNLSFLWLGNLHHPPLHPTPTKDPRATIRACM